MNSKLLFEIGNIHTGNIYAVEAVLPFDIIEIHGPFGNENPADHYAHELAHQHPGKYDRIEVVILNLDSFSASRRIVRDEGSHTGYSYAV